MFKFPKIKHKVKLSPGEINSFLLKDRPGVVEWCEKNITLNDSYVYPGRFRAFAWQREPLAAIEKWKKVIFLFPPQMGKSTLADMVMFYYMAVMRTKGMIIYDRADTIKTIFGTRISTMIKDTPVLRELWDGVEDHLSQDNIILKQSLWRMASAQNERTMSSFAAGFVVCSEVSKWKEMPFNPVEMAAGRGGAYYKKGGQRMLLESTPLKIGDYLYREIYKSGTLVLHPYVPCPHCGEYQELIDSQIKLRNETDKYTAERIRKEKHTAAFYECLYCKEEITEQQRAAIDDRVIWAAPLIDQEDFTQEPERIRKDGTIIGDRSQYDSVCFQGSRLLDVAFEFYECLARFFESKADSQRMIMYQTETMGRYWGKKSRGLSINYIESKKTNYYQHGEDAAFSKDVVALTCGVDTQDDGFYYLIIGWKPQNAWCVVRHGFITCPTKIDLYKDPNEVFLKVADELMLIPTMREDGTYLNIVSGLIDKGGHRASQVEYICEHLHQFRPYVGLTTTDPKKPLIYKSNSGNFYLGQSVAFSRITGDMLEGSDWEIPQDVGIQFIKQVTGHYFIKKTLLDGTIKEEFKKDENDHYRSCLNYAYAAALRVNLPKMLYNESYIPRLEAYSKKIIAPENRPTPATTPKPQRAKNYYNRTRSDNSYFSRV